MVKVTGVDDREPMRRVPLRQMLDQFFQVVPSATYRRGCIYDNLHNRCVTLK